MFYQEQTQVENARFTDPSSVALRCRRRPLSRQLLLGGWALFGDDVQMVGEFLLVVLDRGIQKLQQLGARRQSLGGRLAACMFGAEFHVSLTHGTQFCTERPDVVETVQTLSL